MCTCVLFLFFFFNDTATTEIYTLSLHDALPIFATAHGARAPCIPKSGMGSSALDARGLGQGPRHVRRRSEEHTSELQSPCNLVCRLLLEKKKDGEVSCAHRADSGRRR